MDKWKKLLKIYFFIRNLKLVIELKPNFKSNENEISFDHNYR